jgi:hypothetical protein
MSETAGRFNTEIAAKRSQVMVTPSSGRHATPTWRDEHGILHAVADGGLPAIHSRPSGTALGACAAFSAGGEGPPCLHCRHPVPHLRPGSPPSSGLDDSSPLRRTMRQRRARHEPAGSTQRPPPPRCDGRYCDPTNARARTSMSGRPANRSRTGHAPRDDRFTATSTDSPTLP